MSQINVKGYHNFQCRTEQLIYVAVLLSIDQLVILHQMVKMSASSKKIQLDEHCGFQAKDFTSDRAFQNHYRDHSQALFQCEKCPIKVNTRKKLSNHNFEYNSSKTCSQCSKTFSKNPFVEQVEGGLNKRGSDQVTEAAHQLLHRRMTMSNYFVRKVGTEAEERKLFKAVVHTNAFNM